MPTKIPWTHETYNPIVGCSKVSEGCKNCYAEKMAARLAAMVCSDKKTISQIMKTPRHYVDVVKMWHDPKIGKIYFKGWNSKTAFVKSALDKPLHWRKPRRIFVSSMGDLFHESVPFEWIDEVIVVAVVCHHHIFQFLTKRENRMAEYFNQAELWTKIIPNATHKYLHHRGIQEPSPAYFAFNCMEAEYKSPIPNLHLGVTCENQKTADERIPILLQIPAAVRFLSLEPLLEAVNLKNIKVSVPRKKGHWVYRFNSLEETHRIYDGPVNIDYEKLNQVIIGCESLGRKAGRFQDGFWDVARNIIDQCKSANIPVFVKQGPVNGNVSHNPEEWPEGDWPRQYPE